MRILNDYTTIRIGQGMVNDLRRDLYSQIQRLSLSFHNRQQLGDLMYRITADTMGIQTLTMNGLFAVLSASILLAGMFVIMLSLDWYLTLLALAVCPALFGAIGLLNKKMSSAATRGSAERKHGLFSSPANALRNTRDPSLYKRRRRGAALSQSQHARAWPLICGSTTCKIFILRW